MSEPKRTGDVNSAEHPRVIDVEENSVAGTNLNDAAVRPLAALPCLRRRPGAAFRGTNDYRLLDRRLSLVNADEPQDCECRSGCAQVCEHGKPPFHFDQSSI